MHAHSHVAHDADLHAGLTCRLLGRMHLLDRNPLEPTVEFEQVAVLLAQLLDLGGILRVLVDPIVWRVLRLAPLRIADAPGGVCLEVLAAPGLVVVEGLLAHRLQARVEDRAQRLLFLQPHGIAVYQVRIGVVGLHLGVRVLDGLLGGIVQRVVLRNVLRVNVGVVDEATRHR